jgi:hypothetical protein
MPRGVWPGGLSVTGNIIPFVSVTGNIILFPIYSSGAGVPLSTPFRVLVFCVVFTYRFGTPAWVWAI